MTDLTDVYREQLKLAAEAAARAKDAGATDADKATVAGGYDPADADNSQARLHLAIAAELRQGFANGLSDSQPKLVMMVDCTTGELLEEVARRMDVTQNSSAARDLASGCRAAATNLDKGVLGWRP